MRAGARGFTLIEVLVALAIVAIGMAAVLGALSSSADTVSRLRDKTFAQWFAMNRIATLRLSGQAPPTGKSNGDDDYAGRKWHWAQEVVTTEVPGVERIDVNVRPADLKVENDDSGWLTTVSGIWGDAVGIPNGYQPDWGAQLPRGAPGGVPGTGGIGTPGVPAPGQPFVPNITPQPSAPTQPPQLTNPNQNQ
ncbi:MAG TPA: type II secretion system minor pseudopilin GspI [Steroidobacteraceae bacterium]